MVSLPIWLVFILALFAAIGLFDRIFVPGVRWFFRTRANRAIEELNTRLQLRIQPFKLTKRQALVDQLMYDSEIVAEVDKRAQETGKPRQVVMAEAAGYAKEIVPQFSSYAYFNIGTRAARWLSKLIYRVRLGYSDDKALKKVDPEATVVFVMNHRSNMDYVLVTYMASTAATLSYAVGEWARIWLLQSLIKAMGAYFIRRVSNNELYRKVLARYVRMATRQGVTQAVFPEGGLSRDGALREPKLGLLSYMVCDFNPDDQRDVVFVPVGVNYDRVMEDRILTSRLENEITGRSFRTSIFGIASFIGRAVFLRLKGKLYRYGYACVSFGTPISLKQWVGDHKINMRSLNDMDRRKNIAKLGDDLMASIGASVPVLPVSLMATVFLKSAGEWISELEVKSRTSELIGRLEAKHAHIYIPREDRDYAVSAGLRMLTLRHLVKEKNGLYHMNQVEGTLLRYYANSIAHFGAGR
jgi:glycerol-3-phosphate O-acyltransferase